MVRSSRQGKRPPPGLEKASGNNRSRFAPRSRGELPARRLAGGPRTQKTHIQPRLNVRGRLTFEEQSHRGNPGGGNGGPAWLVDAIGLFEPFAFGFKLASFGFPFSFDPLGLGFAAVLDLVGPDLTALFLKVRFDFARGFG